MPLFKARIAEIRRYVDIPVYAKDEAAAKDYMNSTRDWICDGAFEGDDLTKLVFSGMIIEVTDPADAPDFPGDSLCWHDADEEIQIASASYGVCDIEYPDYPEDLGDEEACAEEEAYYAAIDKKLDKESEQLDRYIDAQHRHDLAYHAFMQGLE